MKKIMLLAICAVAVMMTGCKSKEQPTGPIAENVQAADLDSVMSEMTEDNTPPPMFLFIKGEKYMEMLYWTQVEEPKKTEDLEEQVYNVWHNGWALQEMFRKNANQYTNLLFEDKVLKVKFIDEVLKDPDGNTPSMGQLHGREGIPSLCARFEVADPKDFIAESWGASIVVTDSYLASHKRLAIKDDESEWGDPKPLPEAIVKKLEQKYGMKTDRMRLCATIGDRYIWGVLQFKGAYANAPKDEYDSERQYALALDVLIDGDKYYVHESLGHYDPAYGPTWNVDDEGIYIPNNIIAAFDGPKGLEICFTHGAPESYEIGMMYVNDNQLKEYVYEMFQVMIDEEIPVWKTDLEQMRKLYVESDPGENKHVELTKWSHCYIDYDNEWVWLRDKDDENGAFFIRKDGKFKLVAVETPNLKPTEMEKNGVHYLCLSGSAGGPATYTEIFAFKDGEQTEHFTALCVYGEIDECHLNGRELTKEEGQAYLDNLPNDASEINAWFRDIDD